ncbi:hypothetical protein RND81_08G217600 [Saponaria officinalis]|uniref:Uncharacterized protein n=1 Tax=Saponaria officinalis TaxID=3572 RepID=A0AAW1JAR8_SAPOF
MMVVRFEPMPHSWQCMIYTIELPICFVIALHYKIFTVSFKLWGASASLAPQVNLPLSTRQIVHVCTSSIRKLVSIDMLLPGFPKLGLIEKLLARGPLGISK